jgi:hypothetical protein
MLCEKNKNDDTVSSCRFVYSKECFQKVSKSDHFVKIHNVEAKTNCKAAISLVYKNGKFVIHEFVDEHNRALQNPETTHMLASHRKIIEVHAPHSHSMLSSSNIHAPDKTAT